MADGGVPRERIKGFASIDYRLSPHPDFPQDPETTPATELRVAKHPDHIRDVSQAMAFLQEKFSIGRRYILIGHSAGAMLAFQLLMGQAALGSSRPYPEPPLPMAVIGVEGIYELRDWNGRFGRTYTGFIAAAFGNDELKWNDAAPACWLEPFSDKVFYLLAWSPEDQLIDREQARGMARKLLEDRVQHKLIEDREGDHDAAWKGGEIIAQLANQAIEELRNWAHHQV